MIDLVLLAIGMTLANDFVITKSAPDFNVTRALDAAHAIAIGVVVVLTAVMALSHALPDWPSTGAGAGYLPRIACVLAVPLFVQVIALLARRHAALRQRMSNLVMALVTMHALVLAIALSWTGPSMSAGVAALHGLGAGLGFGLILTLSTAMRERLETADVPPRLRGAPIALLNAGLIALATGGFADLVAD